MKINLEEYHQEVTRKYLSLGKAYPKELERKLREDNYKTNYLVRNVSRIEILELRKKGLSFSKLPEKDRTRIWSYIFKKTQYLDIGHMAIDHFKDLQRKNNPELIQYWPELKTWVGTIENWAHADMLASLYCDILSEAPEVIYPELLKWSKTKSPWKNRMAIVSLLYYFNPKRHRPSFIEVMAILEPHLQSDHYYLQKAVGWSLRELTKAHPEETWKFMQLRATEISPTAFSAAIEKLSVQKKEHLKLLRKEARRKPKRKAS